MVFKKFELIIEGNNPIIRCTLINENGLFSKGKIVVRDICKHKHYNDQGWFKFMDNGDLIFNNEPIETFYRSGLKTYEINE